jgi:hypothetical protein
MVIASGAPSHGGGERAMRYPQRINRSVQLLYSSIYFPEIQKVSTSRAIEM